MSERAKHTPGPWYVKRTGWAFWELQIGAEVLDNDVSIASIWERDDAVRLAADANARLIAAAPDLLEAGSALIEDVADGGIDLASVADDAPIPVPAYKLRNLQAAIAKAEGQDGA